MEKADKIKLIKELISGRDYQQSNGVGSILKSEESLSKLTIEEFEMLGVFLHKERNSCLGIYPITDDMDFDEEFQKFISYVTEEIMKRPTNHGNAVRV